MERQKTRRQTHRSYQEERNKGKGKKNLVGQKTNKDSPIKVKRDVAILVIQFEPERQTDRHTDNQADGQVRKQVDRLR